MHMLSINRINLVTAILSVCLAFTSMGAPPVIIKKLYTVDDAGTLRAGVLVLPGDYATTTDSLALVTFDHGTGEAGDGTLGTVERIYNNGSPVGLAAAGTLTAFTDPVTGQNWRFAAFGLQGVSGWCAYAEQGAYALRNDILKNYRICTARVGKTGLSAGAEVTWEAITRDATFRLYCCAVPMSTPAPAYGSFQNVVAGRIKVWAFHGLYDGNYTAPDNTQRLVGYVDALQPGLTHATYYAGGHCCWATYFDPNYRESVTYYVGKTKFTRNLNIYELLLASAQGSGFVFDTASATSSQPPGTTTKAVPVVTVSGTTATLDATGSTGNGGIGSWYWTYTAPTGAPAPYFSDGRSDGGTQLGTKTLLGLSTGTWSFTLTVQDKYGGFNSASTTATVGGGTPAPTKKVTSVSTSVVNGLIIVTITWSDNTTSTFQ